MHVKFLEAILTENIFEVSQLLNQGIDLGFHYSKYSDNTALHLVMIGGNEELIKLILKKSTSVNQTNVLNKTALHYAASCCNAVIVKLLLDAGADVYAEDIFGNIPMFYAVMEDTFGRVAEYNKPRAEIIKMLLSRMNKTYFDGHKKESKLLVIAQNMLDMLNDKSHNSKLKH
ncbi:MAG: ankyrin repeat domain-containing protein [Rickettsiaceae bacterium H1]|nr:ankyrin repeat domain-containing protein [Rickettsiaceae bacterium H1]